MRRRILLTLVLAAMLATPALGGCTLRRITRPPSPYCRGGDPLAGVYHPQRLEVKSRCRVAAGVVAAVKFEPYDGDIHIDLTLDEADRGLLSAGNDAVGGDLVVEIIPQDRGVVAVPEVGERVSVVGPWVEDTAHAWREIHPAWWVSSGRIIPASPVELGRVRELLSGRESETYSGRD